MPRCTKGGRDALSQTVSPPGNAGTITREGQGDPTGESPREKTVDRGKKVQQPNKNQTKKPTTNPQQPQPQREQTNKKKNKKTQTPNYLTNDRTG